METSPFLSGRLLRPGHPLPVQLVPVDAAVQLKQVCADLVAGDGYELYEPQVKVVGTRLGVLGGKEYLALVRGCYSAEQFV